MKKTISILLALLLVCLLVLPAGATVIYPPLPILSDEYGYTYDVEETEDGKVLTDVRYVGPSLLTPITADAAEGIYVPKTLGDVPVTPENFTGAVFAFYFGSKAQSDFRLDEDNTQFTLIDGMLFTKDGKTLVAVPGNLVQGIVRIPDGTEKLGEYSVVIKNPPVENEQSVCIVIPASVTEIDENFAGGKTPALAGSAGSAAERFAEENGLTFVLLGEGHTHTYFRCEKEATCLHGGEITVTCPCGVCIYGEQSKPLSHNWTTRRTEKEDGKTYIEVYCSRCGEIRSSNLADTEDIDCDCLCHKINRTWALEVTKDNWTQVLRNAIFRFKLAFWHLTGTHQFCGCGARHY